MATLTFAYNHARDPMNPDDLASKIATSLTLASSPVVDINPTQIIVTHPNVTSANTAAIQTVINAYVFDPTWTGGVVGNLRSKAQTALATNVSYIGSAAIPAGTALTTTQLTTEVRALRAQVTSLAKQNDALIKLALGILDDASGT